MSNEYVKVNDEWVPESVSSAINSEMPDMESLYLDRNDSKYNEFVNSLGIGVDKYEKSKTYSYCVFIDGGNYGLW